MKKIDEKTLSILSRVTVDGNKILLTCGQLDRKEYLLINEVLMNMGGKWNKKEKAHIFTEDPVNKLEQILLSGEIIPPKKYGYFPTPKIIVEKMIKLAELKPGMTVLEPSAGQGAILDLIPDYCKIFCAELLEENHKILLKKGYRSYNMDFLSFGSLNNIDRIIMNPPFERQQDIDHVLHAIDFLKPGGRIVAIMSAGVLFRENKKTVAFKDIINKFGYIERLPENSFKESGTGVNTCLVVINK